MARKPIDFRKANQAKVRFVLREVLGLEFAHGRRRWVCPICGHRSISVSRSGWGWYCGGCARGGTAVELVMHCRNVDAYSAGLEIVSRMG